MLYTPIMRQQYARLCALDPSLPLVPAAAKLADAYLSAFENIQNRQQIELEKLASTHANYIEEATQDAHPEEGLTPLEALERHHRIIEAVNIALIKDILDIDSTELDLDGDSDLKITRIPAAIFKDPELTNYFNKLTKLSCNDGYVTQLCVRDLPSLDTLSFNRNAATFLKIENLPSLQHFECADNKLQGVMDLRNFPNLQLVNVADNDLRELHVEGLQQLTALYCRANSIRLLTVDSPAIFTIDCSDNYLESISIAHITYLVLPSSADSALTPVLDLRNNNLNSLPGNLVGKFGKEWALKALHGENEESDSLSSTEVREYTDDDAPSEYVLVNLLEAPPTLLVQYYSEGENAEPKPEIIKEHAKALRRSL